MRHAIAILLFGILAGDVTLGRPTPPAGYKYDCEVVAVAVAKPVMLVITQQGTGCVPCNKAKDALRKAKDLPFQVQYTTKHPKWLEVTPTFVWQDESGQTWQQAGWTKLSDLLGKYERSRSAKAMAVKARRPYLVASVSGFHSHRCGKCGMVWSHGDESRGNVAAHTCPMCGRVEWLKW